MGLELWIFGLLAVLAVLAAARVRASVVGAVHELCRCTRTFVCCAALRGNGGCAQATQKYGMFSVH